MAGLGRSAVRKHGDEAGVSAPAPGVATGVACIRGLRRRDLACTHPIIGLLGGFWLAFQHIRSECYLFKYIYWAFYLFILVAHYLQKYSTIIGSNTCSSTHPIYLFSYLRGDICSSQCKEFNGASYILQKNHDRRDNL